MTTASPDAARVSATADTPWHADAPRRRGRAAISAPTLTLLAVVAVATSAYAAAAQLVAMPVLNPDELRYTLAARELLEGEWLNLRGHDYGYGAFYPVVLAPILAMSDGVESAYPIFKVANALLFALAAVPIYLLARRLLSPWWSVAVAAMSVAIPSSIYTSLVVTESASYLLFSIAMLAVVMALERPSFARQLAVLGAIALASTVRAQFALLLPAFLAAYALLWSVDAGRVRLRQAAVRVWPTLGALLLGIAAFAARPLLTWSSPKESLGGYEDLWRVYDPVDVGKWVVYHLAGLELYLFIVPFAVAPIVIVALLRAARRGAPREGAFAAAFIAVNGVLLLVAAAFASTPYGYSQLHERYLFYVAPLWLVVLALWVSSGVPRPLVPTAIGVGVALVLPAILPFGLIAGDLVVEVVPSALWSGAWAFLEGYPLVDGRRALAACVIALAVVTAFLPRRLGPTAPVLVVAGFVGTSVLAWQRQADMPDAFQLADDTTRAWVDDAVADGSRTTKVYLASPRCPESELTRHALFMTEFFNTSIVRAASIGNSFTDGLPRDRVKVGSGGRLLLPGGRPLVSDYVVTQPGIRLEGDRVAEGTGADLVLWETRGVVKVAGAHVRAADLETADCA